MNLNCAVTLLRYNVTLPPNNATVDSILPNNIDLNNTTKRSTRITRRHTIRDKPVIGDDDDQSVNIKKDKCMVKKTQFSKNDPEKSVTSQKGHKKKSRKSVSIKSTKNNSTNSNNNKVPITSVNFNKDCGTTNSMRISLKNKNKTSKSISSNKKKCAMNSVCKNDTLHDLEKSNDFVTLKRPKKKLSSKSVTSFKKKSIANDVDNNDIFNKSDDLIFSRKRGRSTLKKVQSQKTGVNICNDKSSQKNKSWSIAFDKLNNVQEPQLSKKIDDNTMMLRSNSKPPKIKKKWSDEWSENKLTNLSKSNNDDFMNGQKIDTNNCSKLIKKAVKNQKSKNANHKKLKTKIEKLSTSSNDSNTCDMVETVDKSVTHIPETQNDDSVLIINGIPTLKQKVVESNIQINSSNSNTATTSSSEVTTVPCTEISKNVLANENDKPSHLRAFKSISDSSYSSVPMMSSECPEISYGISILSEAISRQCNELINKNNEIKLPERINEKNSSPNKINLSSRYQVPSAKVSPQIIRNDVFKKIVKCPSQLSEQSFENEVQQSNAENQVHILSERFNIPLHSLKKTVLDEPLSMLRKCYCESLDSSMITVVPLIDTKINLDVNSTSRNINIDYRIDPMSESAAYEKSNLKDLMEELAKTMPSWSLSIVLNPPRYVISHMSIGTTGVPIANKSIVLDEYFRATVYIDQCLIYTYCKRYITAAEIINLIKELDSI